MAMDRKFSEFEFLPGSGFYIIRAAGFLEEVPGFFSRAMDRSNFINPQTA